MNFLLLQHGVCDAQYVRRLVGKVSAKNSIGGMKLSTYYVLLLEVEDVTEQTGMIHKLSFASRVSLFKTSCK